MAGGIGDCSTDGMPGFEPSFTSLAVCVSCCRSASCELSSCGRSVFGVVCLVADQHQILVWRFGKEIAAHPLCGAAPTTVLALDNSANSVDCTASVFGGIEVIGGTSKDAEGTVVVGGVDPVAVRGSAVVPGSVSNAKSKPKIGVQ